jgi:hypothetical protein
MSPGVVDMSTIFVDETTMDLPVNPGGRLSETDPVPSVAPIPLNVLVPVTA